MLNLTSVCNVVAAACAVGAANTSGVNLTVCLISAILMIALGIISKSDGEFQ